MDDSKLSVVENPQPMDQGTLTDLQWTVLQFADRMTTNGWVEDGLFQQLRLLCFSDRELVELTAVTAAYNCVGRFLLTLGIN